MNVKNSLDAWYYIYKSIFLTVTDRLPKILVSARFCLVEYPGEMWFQSKFYKAFFLWTYLMIFVSFAEAVSMYLVFFQEQRKTFLPLEKQYVIIVRKRSVAFSRKFFFLVNSNMVNLLSFSVLSSV